MEKKSERNRESTLIGAKLPSPTDRMIRTAVIRVDSRSSTVRLDGSPGTGFAVAADHSAIAEFRGANPTAGSNPNRYEHVALW